MHNAVFASVGVQRDVQYAEDSVPAPFREHKRTILCALTGVQYPVGAVRQFHSAGKGHPARCDRFRTGIDDGHGVTAIDTSGKVRRQWFAERGELLARKFRLILSSKNSDVEFSLGVWILQGLTKIRQINIPGIPVKQGSQHFSQGKQKEMTRAAPT